MSEKQSKPKDIFSLFGTTKKKNKPVEKFKRDPRWDDPKFVPMQPFKSLGQALQVRTCGDQLIDPRPFYILGDRDIKVLQFWIIGVREKKLAPDRLLLGESSVAFSC